MYLITNTDRDIVDVQIEQCRSSDGALWDTIGKYSAAGLFLPDMYVETPLGYHDHDHAHQFFTSFMIQQLVFVYFFW